MQYIKTYFPNLTPKQENQFMALGQLYTDWNAKINVISRKDIENLYLHHILHSLGIAKTINFADGSEILDVGTGGGFPGIPLAILFPECKFHLIDRIGKKIKVAANVAESIDLENVTFQHGSVEENKSEYDFVVSRAVMPLPDLLKRTRYSKKDIDRIRLERLLQRRLFRHEKSRLCANCKKIGSNENCPISIQHAPGKYLCFMGHGQ